jgi:hypothetical protein
MILFYTKTDGHIFAVIDGRVHGEQHLRCSVNPGIQEENIGKFIIGWIENTNGRVAYNLDKFELLQEFEAITPTSPLDYKIDTDTGELYEIDK